MSPRTMVSAPRSGADARRGPSLVGGGNAAAARQGKHWFPGQQAPVPRISFRPSSTGKRKDRMAELPVPKSVRTLKRGHEERLLAYVPAAGAGMMAAGTPAEPAVISVNPPDQTYANTPFQIRPQRR